MTDNELVPGRALVSQQDEFQRRLPPGWSIKSWRADVHRDYASTWRTATQRDYETLGIQTTLDVQLMHEPTQTEFAIRCHEAPDWEWLTAALLLAQRVQNGIEVSIAHGRWWW